MSVPAAFLGVILIWSTTPLAIQWSGDGVGFLFGLASRMVIGLTVAALLIGLRRSALPVHRDAVLTYLTAGLGLFAAMTVVYWSAQHIPSGWISVIFALTPMITGILAAVWLNETGLTPARLSGLLIGLVGLALVFSGGQQLGETAIHGILGVLLATCVHSVTTVAIKRTQGDLSALDVTTGGLLVATPLYLITFTVADGGLPASVPLRTGLAIGYLGLMGSVVGFIMFFYVLRRVEATRVALITLVTPVLALLLGNRFNDETVAPVVWVGSFTIMTGLALFEFGGRVAHRLVIRRTARDDRNQATQDQHHQL